MHVHGLALAQQLTGAHIVLQARLMHKRKALLEHSSMSHDQALRRPAQIPMVVCIAKLHHKL